MECARAREERLVAAFIFAMTVHVTSLGLLRGRLGVAWRQRLADSQWNDIPPPSGALAAEESIAATTAVGSTAGGFAADSHKLVVADGVWLLAGGRNGESTTSLRSSAGKAHYIDCDCCRRRGGAGARRYFLALGESARSSVRRARRLSTRAGLRSTAA